VKPEVSTLDFGNAVQLSGFRIPALSTRRTETELELNNGQTFAIAGLLNNNMTQTMQKIPGIGDIPILGVLFKSKAAQKGRTELVVMITPEILPNNSGGVTRELPRLQEPFLPALAPKGTTEMPPAHFTPAARSGADAAAAAAAGKVTVPQPAIAAPAATDSAAAAKTMRELTPESATPQLKKAQPTPVNAAPTAAVARPVTEDKKAGEKAQKDEHARAEAAKAVDGKARAKQMEEDKKLQEKASKDAAIAAKRQAEIDRNASEAAAKRAQEQAKKQAEIDKKLQSAQKDYEAEVAKIKKP
jgi:hypothetical protein